eukprot:1153224-Pelagomonas_calceolata.AAC.3
MQGVLHKMFTLISSASTTEKSREKLRAKVIACFENLPVCVCVCVRPCAQACRGVQELVRLQAEQKEDMLRMAHAFTTTQVMRAERDAEVRSLEICVG